HRTMHLLMPNLQYIKLIWWVDQKQVNHTLRGTVGRCVGIIMVGIVANFRTATRQNSDIGLRFAKVNDKYFSVLFLPIYCFYGMALPPM
ncbi:MAG TPA: hypothetical protein VLR89_09165, partial [Anaerolineaceae bacterium]|nr:hypothetical protein [Anaerolineaceae bacterium]